MTEDELDEIEHEEQVLEEEENGDENKVDKIGQD